MLGVWFYVLHVSGSCELNFRKQNKHFKKRHRRSSFHLLHHFICLLNYCSATFLQIGSLYKRGAQLIRTKSNDQCFSFVTPDNSEPQLMTSIISELVCSLQKRGRDVRWIIGCLCLCLQILVRVAHCAVYKREKLNIDELFDNTCRNPWIIGLLDDTYK